MRRPLCPLCHDLLGRGSCSLRSSTHTHTQDRLLASIFSRPQAPEHDICWARRSDARKKISSRSPTRHPGSQNANSFAGAVAQTVQRRLFDGLRWRPRYPTLLTNATAAQRQMLASTSHLTSHETGRWPRLDTPRTNCYRCFGSRRIQMHSPRIRTISTWEDGSLTSPMARPRRLGARAWIKVQTLCQEPIFAGMTTAVSCPWA